ncbi:MAG TPA: hypothetical protein VL576_03180 [Candidatus Paceibacterota bacterium]|jgi:hypothetical protein|nr:hypothetical protein [Candidatus Paceibacterota bacterium]
MIKKSFCILFAIVGIVVIYVACFTLTFNDNRAYTAMIGIVTAMIGVYWFPWETLSKPGSAAAIRRF